MKILCVSLLRIGDVVMTTPALASLKARYPESEIDLLINESSQGISGLIPHIHKTFLFPRKCLQAGLGQVDRPIFEPYDLLSNLVEKLNSNKYDMIINLTHNRLSGYLCHLLHGTEKLGLVINEKSFPRFGNVWFRYFNDIYGSESKSVMHYADVLQNGVGESSGARSLELKETEAGITQSKKYSSELSNTILIQPLTSDKSKNWDLCNYEALMNRISGFIPGIQYMILCAPFERDGLVSWVSDLQANGLKVSLVSENLETTYSLLKRSQFLITGDTSIKHIAAAADCDLLELALGWSQPVRTGAYKDGALIIKSAKNEDLFPEEVFEVFKYAYHKKNKNSVNRIDEKKLNKTIGVFQVDMSTGDMFLLQSIRRGSEQKNIRNVIALMSWLFTLKGLHRSALPPVGSISMKLLRLIKKSNFISDENLFSILSNIETDLKQITHVIRSTEKKIFLSIKERFALKDEFFLEEEDIDALSNAENVANVSGYMSDRLKRIKGSQKGIYVPRTIQCSLEDLVCLTTVQEKMTTSMKSIIRSQSSEKFA